MMRALWSGVSGLKVHQTKMDVIGNNIANVNTVGFKASSVTFSDILYQTTQSATGPNALTGSAGRNAMQIGLGANVASIKAAMNQTGASQRTDNPFDLMIEGDGFFIVNSGGTNYFTKAGSFDVDGGGNLCTPSGALVMGWHVDRATEEIVVDAVKPLRIMSAENMMTPPEATRAAYVTGNLDSKDLQLTEGRIINIEFYDALGHSYTADFKIIQDETNSNEYSVVLRDVKGEDGKSILIDETVEADGSVKYGIKTGMSVSIDGTSLASVDADSGDITGQNIKLTFDAGEGTFKSIGAGTSTTDQKTISFKVNGPEPSAFRDLEIDFSTITMFSSGGSSHLEAYKGDLNNNNAGKRAGHLSGISIDLAGKIYGSYDNGDRRLLGQIAVASFANPTGLEAVGNNMYAATQNSGDFNGIGEDPTLGGGGLTTGVLEMSNVDLAAQFTEMITTQRGFQANSRIITTSDTMLDELINLKR